MNLNNISKKEIIMFTVGAVMTLVTVSIFVPIILIAGAIYIFNGMFEGGNDNYSEGIDEWTKQLTEEEEDV